MSTLSFLNLAKPTRIKTAKHKQQIFEDALVLERSQGESEAERDGG